MDDYANAHRPAMPELSVAERAGNFREVELGYDEKTAQRRVQALPALRPGMAGLDGDRQAPGAACSAGQQQEKGG